MPDPRQENPTDREKEMPDIREADPSRPNTPSPRQDTEIITLGEESENPFAG